MDFGIASSRACSPRAHGLDWEPGFLCRTGGWDKLLLHRVLPSVHSDASKPWLAVTFHTHLNGGMSAGRPMTCASSVAARLDQDVIQVNQRFSLSQVMHSNPNHIFADW